MKHSAPRLIHRFLEESARREPQKCAVVHDQRRTTYGELDAQANGLASWLVGNGLVPGDRVVMLPGNSLEYVVSY